MELGFENFRPDGGVRRRVRHQNADDKSGGGPPKAVARSEVRRHHGPVRRYAGSRCETAGAGRGGRFQKISVLFVDDSLAFLETFRELCSDFVEPDLGNPYRRDRRPGAGDVAGQHSIDLVVLDIIMPMVDGFQLLGIINRRYPGLKIAVMTAQGQRRQPRGRACPAARNCSSKSRFRPRASKWFSTC